MGLPSTTNGRDGGLQEDEAGYELHNDGDVTGIRRPLPSPPPASIFAFVSFPEEIDYSASDPTDIYWFHWTQLDLAYLHAILYTTSFFFDDLAGRKSERTKYHSYRTVSELNKQLSDPQTALTDSTTTVVMFMLFITECFGDMESAHMHMMGLKKIFDLRGGLKSYEGKPLLQEKIRRMCTGCKPVYCQGISSSACDLSSQVRHFEHWSIDQSCFSRSRDLIYGLDRQLYICVKNVQILTQMINTSHKTGEKLADMTLEKFLTSIQSHLLVLDFYDDARDSLVEVLRLSLHAYLTTVFWSFPGLKTEYPLLAVQFQEACLAFSPTTAEETFLFAWALMVGAISLFQNRDQEWLSEILYPLIQTSLGTLWLEAKASLRQVMWIESLHDSGGTEVFRRYITRKNSEAAISLRRV
ncbi:uncharacterized protein CLUP02_00152 [Colletotrichum lupini]|uniref:Uncharacterized protein n=1 Tax=Colletotrichum lupini TaxID=145971 RepID=A0A9Q8W8H4_9PEZI|nr:uncharacterized protein CLUP02_00152 [Colletotrichum lupini]UQC73507.1 hypothetical protein CLUP02_00152 [Colletotrichum lupini]